MLVLKLFRCFRFVFNTLIFWGWYLAWGYHRIFMVFTPLAWVGNLKYRNPIGKCVFSWWAFVLVVASELFVFFFTVFNIWLMTNYAYLRNDCLSMDYSLWLIVYGYAVWPMWLYGWVGFRPHSSTDLY